MNRMYFVFISFHFKHVTEKPKQAIFISVINFMSVILIRVALHGTNYNSKVF